MEKLNLRQNVYKKNIKNFVILRFFNVCSSLRSPLIEENHKPETHLIPLSVSKAILNKKIFNLGANKQTSIKQFLDNLSKFLKQDLKINYF